MCDGISHGITREEECCGWLWKKTGVFSGWKYRFFSLRGAILTYYDKFPAEEYLSSCHFSSSFVPTKGETCPKGVVRIAHVEPSGKSSIAFKVYGVSGKILDLRAETPKVCHQWIHSLSLAARLGRRKESCISSDSSSTSESCGSEEFDLGRNSIPVGKAGWLRKRGNRRKTWKNRYFVLQGSMLSFHEDGLPWTVPDGRAYVTGVQISKSSNTGLIVNLSIGRDLILHSKTKEERDQWYTALSIAVAGT